MFEFSQLRCFVAVAEEMHFGRGAERLNMTQPPVSRQVQVLERVLGTPLFDRTSRSVKLTPAGKRFLVEAKHILRISQDAAAIAKRVASGEVGNLAISFTAASGYSYLPHLIDVCCSKLPSTQLILREMITSDQIQALESGQVDIGLLRGRFNLKGYEKRRILREKLIAAIPASDPKASKETLTLQDFHASNFIMYTPQRAGYFHDMLNKHFERANVEPIFTQYMSQIHTMLSLVHANLGAAIVPEAASVLKFSNVEYRPLELPSHYPVELHIVWKKNNDNPCIPSLLKHIEEQ
ncbi:LysR substrate-binding domain-containing protein [Hirschia baltica]|uniref:Transcriptional regulator, LysR family n=1 Tax=Hirschia baltica (strain ATCC 49814 / DSM 5838 / IFAM 1418) TaxID=582402 RepID=C6XNZ9_HIRBI|nr:LysR substrate-binding domain-containing protein [Hirschia baltica]ACT60179.1 transcriptional regulator, LysR family [Hirschia baltica ATCC 49814]